jgi:hypothetical protein
VMVVAPGAQAPSCMHYEYNDNINGNDRDGIPCKHSPYHGIPCKHSPHCIQT